MKTILTALIAVLIATPALAQTPSDIEAVEYDPNGSQWFVSCGSSTMLSTSDLGDTWEYFGTAHATHGMEVMGEVLFVIDNDSIRAYDLNTAEQLGTTSVIGAGFLNGMGNDGNGMLIISDFSTGRILKVDATDPADMIVSTLVGNTGTTPNGVVVDVANGRAVIVNWGGNADILAVDLDSGAVTTIVNGTGLGNCDGIDMDSDGRYYVSSWLPNRITRFSNDFTQTEAVVNSGLNHPADISFDETNHILGVANSGSNQVTFHQFEAETNGIGIADINMNSEVELIGNNLAFEVFQPGNYNISAFTLSGKLLDSMAIDIPAGKTNVSLERLPRMMQNAAVIHVSGTDIDQSFKLGLRQP
jgi:sugar lactone lactonase YvrE